MKLPLETARQLSLRLQRQLQWHAEAPVAAAPAGSRRRPREVGEGSTEGA